LVLPVAGLQILGLLVGITALLYMPVATLGAAYLAFCVASLLLPNAAHASWLSRSAPTREPVLWQYWASATGLLAALCVGHAAAQFLLFAELLRPKASVCDTLGQTAGITCSRHMPFSAVLVPFVITAANRLTACAHPLLHFLWGMLMTAC
jgi:hypothetical protein